MRRQFLILLLLLPAALSAQKRAFTPADWYRLTTLSSPALSPDGRLVAVTVTTVKEAENKRHSEVWVVPAAGGTPVRYTSPAFESSNPRFSPDGKYLLFTSQRPESKGNTWALRVDQPAGEAFQVDGYMNGSLPSNKSFVVWSEADTAASRADGRATDPFAAMQPMARPPFGSITKPLDAKRFDGRHIVQFPYKANGQGFVPNPREARVYRPLQIVLQNVGDTAKKKITNDRYSHRNAVVSPDGKWVAFTADPQLRADSVVQAERDSIARLPYDAARDETPRNDNDIFIMPITGGTARRLTNAPGDEGSVEWSPDGKQIAFIAAPART